MPKTSRPKLSLKWAILRPASCFLAIAGHQLLDTAARYHNMQNQQKLMHNDQENGLKPHLGPFLAPNGPF